MGLCNQIYDRLPTGSFMQDSGYYHSKYKLTPMDDERLEFSEVDIKEITTVWEETETPA